MPPECMSGGLIYKQYKLLIAPRIIPKVWTPLDFTNGSINYS